ncbi:hypothetical protein ACJMK2_036107 [Sinanodonta woodiana]|uniref:SPIN-DOC-like zinc-finger domain-containing protein n=1 Tax=Sinanodonta woodiana TaxID=1069815 RepID=A0ABD3WKA1_SINWO
MAAYRKRKVDNENRQLNDDWTVQYCFVPQQTNVICLLCHSTVAVAKISNIKRHYETKSIEISTTLSGTNEQLELNL